MGNGKFLAALGAVVFCATALLTTQSPAAVLHGVCTPACSESTVGGSDITPMGDATSFGFTGPNKSGDFYLEVLVPNTPGNEALSFMITGTNTANDTVTSLLADSTPFEGPPNGVKLADYLGNPSGKNPLNAFLPATKVYASAATGYYVYQLDFGQVDFKHIGDPSFTTSYSLPSGSVLLAYLQTCPDDDKSCWTATANSSALLVTKTPEPASIALLGAGLAGLGLRKRKRAA